MTVQWWHWVVGGILLSLAELVIPSFTILWFGLGGILVGVVLLLYPRLSLEGQLVSWLIFSGAFVWAWFRFLRPKINRTKAGLSKEAAIGQIGMVSEGGGDFKKGKVRFQVPLMGDDEWPFVSSEQLMPGDRVKVVDVDGHFLRVKKEAPH